MPLGASDVDALDLFDEVANAPEHGLTVHLERGDMLVINNYTLLHARARSTTHPQPGREHRLVRLWLDSPVSAPHCAGAMKP